MSYSENKEDDMMRPSLRREYRTVPAAGYVQGGHAVSMDAEPVYIYGKQPDELRRPDGTRI